MQIFLFILGLLLFTSLVIVHEWGHFFVARRNGVKVEEFGLGLPPRAWGKKLKSGMMVSLNWLPIGGFVKLKGENDSDTRPGSFGAAPLSTKTKIILAGVIMNLIAGVLLLTVLAWVGMPRLITKETVGQDQFTVASDTRVVHQDLIASYVQPDSPAEKIGLAPRDIILEVKSGDDARQIKSAPQLKAATQDFAGQTVQLTYKHNNNQTTTKKVTLRSAAEVEASLNTDNPKGNLGVSPTELQIRRSTWSAPVVALGFTEQLFELTLKGLGNAFSGLGSLIAGAVTGNDQARANGSSRATEQIGGPVAIGAILWGSGTLGILFVLMIIAIISLTLALINALPIPALDGGRLSLILFSRLILRRPLSRSVEERIVGASMALILGLLVLITIVDVRRFL
ncbi:MAG TPA: M50 family metallopeptidase [Candidatus Saccharimonadales bacterium]|nr:M50 family metallopeptidase [Candidatus Saccharimonadales bacterium]